MDCTGGLLFKKRKAAGMDVFTVASHLGLETANYDLKEIGIYEFTPEEEEALVKLLNLTEAERAEIFPYNAQSREKSHG